MTDDDDDLRFGDVKGGNRGQKGKSPGGDVFDTLFDAIVAIVIIYVMLRVAEILLEISLPFI